jgi:KaiC/GvpD/RAD55 family RecA-like ATPase
MSPIENSDRMKPKISFTQLGRDECFERQLPVVTGYSVLDTLLCGGLPQKYAVTLTSPPCDEKDLIIKRFLDTGAESDEPTFYVTIEPSLAQSLVQHRSPVFYMFVCNPQGETLLRNTLNTSVLNGVENLTNLNVALTSAIRKLDPSQKGTRRMCLNIISDVLLSHGAVQTRRWLTELLTQLKSTGFTTIAIIDPQIHPPEELHAILDLFEGEINIRETETDQGSGRFLKIKRLSNQKYIKDETYLTEEEAQDKRFSDMKDLRSGGFIRLS